MLYKQAGHDQSVEGIAKREPRFPPLRYTSDPKNSEAEEPMQVSLTSQLCSACFGLDGESSPVNFTP